MWSYTPSGDNPADLLTRGVSTQQLIQSQLWLQEPQWLCSRVDWPEWIPASTLHLQLVSENIDKEQSDQPVDNTGVTGIHVIINICCYSTTDKLLAVTLYVLRFIHNLHKQHPRLTGPLNAHELNTARRFWISNCQAVCYPTEILYLLKQRRTCPNLVKQLRLYLDKDHLLRCGGRIYNAPVAELTKFLYLLPPKHPLTNMIIQDTHKKLHHGGAATTITALRQIYWIPTIRQHVRAQLRRCVTCAKTMGKPYQIPDPPPLPKVRVGNSRPFTVTGVDFTGTLYVKESNVEHKAYIFLFTCASTRAIHLEIVTDLSTETFLLASEGCQSQVTTCCYDMTTPQPILPLRRN